MIDPQVGERVCVIRGPWRGEAGEISRVDHDDVAGTILELRLGDDRLLRVPPEWCEEDR
jgi:transcription antitermination factor NusG